MGMLDVVILAATAVFATALYMAIRGYLFMSSVADKVLVVLSGEDNVSDHAYRKVEKLLKKISFAHATMMLTFWPVVVVRNPSRILKNISEATEVTAAKDIFMYLITTVPELEHVRNNWVDKGYIVLAEDLSIH